MARDSKKKIPLENSSIVIVCEGTETENKYLEELAKESVYSEYRVVPQVSEKVDKKAKKSRKREIEFQLEKGEVGAFTGPEYYVGLPEIDLQTYNTYSCEPRKWVRATQLFMERKGFAEGWAVYDLDNKSGRTNERHQEARNDASNIDNLHIAFSSYSIEEWFLLHFERNTNAFDNSECLGTKNGCRKDDERCGSAKCTHKDNCHGKKCIAGYLREKGYISDYSKRNGEAYVAITKDNLYRACVNAAWSRSLKHNAQPFECNPYTDIDKLILRLLGKESTIDVRWVSVGEEFKAGSSKLIIHIEDQQIKLECLSKTGFLVDPDSIYWCNDDYQCIVKANNLNNKTECNCEQTIEIENKPEGNAILCIKSGRQEVYAEIS